MRQMKRGFLILCTAMLLTGCGAKIPDMTEEQSKEVAEYAAGLLMKYDTHHKSRLLSDAELEAELKRLEALAVRKAELAELDQALKEQKEAEKQEQNQNQTDVIMPEESAGQGKYVEEFYGLEGVTVRYQGYNVADAYPEGGEDIYFRMQANSGKKLLVVNFVAKNETDSDITLDMISIAPRFKIGINGEAAHYALSTLLMDDLANFRGTLAAGEETNLVIMAEITEEKAGSIDSVKVIMQNGLNSATILMD